VRELKENFKERAKKGTRALAKLTEVEARFEKLDAEVAW